MVNDMMTGQPVPPTLMYVPPVRNKGFRAGLIEGNQWVFISPDHSSYFLGGYLRRGRLTSHYVIDFSAKDEVMVC